MSNSGRPIETAVRKTEPLALREVLEAIEPVTAVWAAPDRPPVLAIGREARINGTGPERFQTVKRESRRLFDRIDADEIPRPARPRLFGGFSFFDETGLDPPWTAFDPAGFVLPSIQVTLAEDRTWVTGFGQAASGDTLSRTISELHAAREANQGSKTAETDVTPASASTTSSKNGGYTGETGLRAERSKWVERVRSIRETISESELQKAVLSAAFDLEIDGAVPIGSVLADLEARYPDCYRFSFTGRDGGSADGAMTFFGASPERLVEKRGRSLSTEALAGTVERGTNSTADNDQIKRLLEDQILATEHDLVAEQITEQLQELGAMVDVGDRTVRTLANVHHLQTPIDASLPPDVHVLDLVELLHPTPAVGGLPTEAAQSTIADVESTVRGWYGAPVGWFDADGDGTFAVGIRSALARPGRVTLFAGNGIVAGSDPETEWNELEAKFEPIREVLE